jgi:hypothetical protein
MRGVEILIFDSKTDSEALFCDLELSMQPPLNPS